MQKVTTDKRYRVLLEAKSTAIILVGVGGTGSALAIDLARLVHHCREQGMDIKMILVDPDQVEEKNVGRQQFSPYEVGKNKAKSMAKRLNLWLGLDIEAIAAPFTFDTTDVINMTTGYWRRVIVGAVDNWEARKQISAAAGWWVDSGNDEYSGQVLVGNQKDKVMLNEMGVASGLPAPHVQMPALIEPPLQLAVPLPAEDDDCAALALRDEQSLNVNRLMATIAAQYVYDIVVRGELTTMRTDCSLNPVSATSVPITRKLLEQHIKVKNA